VNALQSVAKWMIPELKKLPPIEGFYVNNSIDFCEKLEHQTIADDEIMVSFDVVALFPSIPIDLAVKYIKDWLLSLNLKDERRNAYLKIAEACMDLIFFIFRGQYYKQTSGTSMGNPLSPILANIFMSKFEMNLASMNVLPRIWYRYVDEIFAVIKRTDIQSTLDMLNSQHNTIKFTVEEERDQMLQFLDINVRRNSDSFEFSIYRKPTNTNLYIKSTSFQAPAQKAAAFHSMAHRLTNVPMSPKDYEKERENVVNIGLLNGYNRKFTDDIDEILSLQFFRDQLQYHIIQTYQKN
jgi:Reverse transcriptase (RNA-dependent DNA polymerase)